MFTSFTISILFLRTWCSPCRLSLWHVNVHCGSSSVVFLYEEIFMLYVHLLLIGCMEFRLKCAASSTLFIFTYHSLFTPFLNHHAVSLSFANTIYTPTVLSRISFCWHVWFNKKKSHARSPLSSVDWTEYLVNQCSIFRNYVLIGQFHTSHFMSGENVQSQCRSVSK